jgi:hypothetical protein
MGDNRFELFGRGLEYARFAEIDAVVVRAAKFRIDNGINRSHDSRHVSCGSTPIAVLSVLCFVTVANQQ